ncbi:GAF domain-containing protein [Pontibacter fetidus]|uniref:GAF domain-containing protein n=1 Tax=Pontibacter fetidus TaxID=2700082 RepID=A0A6B2H5S8_9BACT|nr:GAF domain-containing protein [Pontibacter fetidus]NDK55657.1 GAF domain-containing protein [Pontibacter fetidus]
MTNSAAPYQVTLNTNYDSEMCGSIPLHLVNLVQPHGVLLVLDKKDLRVLQVSENISSFLPIAPDEILGKTLSDFLSEDKKGEILAKIKTQASQDKIPFTLSFSTHGEQKVFTSVILPQEDYILVEMEESVNAPAEYFIGLYQQIKYVTTLLKQAETIEELAQRFTEEFKKLTGFDKVMVYQFDPQWNGIVIGQAEEDDMDDYMGLRFPASDVPRQARDLYFRNPYRLIPTREYTPVKLVPVINPVTQRFTDLSESNLRSVANVHLEYLANMKITASMSLPIIIEDKLWGLISCHHKTAKYPGYELRSAMELLAGILSAQIEVKQRVEDMSLRVHLRSIHVKLMEQLYTSANFAEGILEGNTTIVDLLSLSGAVVAYEGNTWTIGTTPDKQEVKDLLSWLRRTKTSGVFATSSLPVDYPHSKDYKDVASGLIALPINAEQGDFILGFRPELIQTVNWGGNPNNAIQMEADGKSYHPRNSFEIYKETVKNTSATWLPEELAASDTLRNAILEKLIKERY